VNKDNMELLDDDDLEKSGVVANCRMNRERRLTGSNGYERELRFHPLDFLRSVYATCGKANWLDLCCGSAMALAEAAAIVQAERLPITIVGVDLVQSSTGIEREYDCLHLVETSLTYWQPHEQFDLITCVHGLNYIGDKLGLIARAAGWLTERGRFVANLDLDNVKIRDHQSESRIDSAELRRNGFTYSTRTKLVQCEGGRQCAFALTYLGADDTVGPNHTGQAAVDSYYEGR
jgi:SAM-dependent methyltransferase